MAAALEPCTKILLENIFALYAATSSLEDERLPGFLAQRGLIPKDEAETLRNLDDRRAAEALLSRGRLTREALAAADDVEAERARLVAAYRDEFANPYIAAARGYVDDVIRPSETRPRLIRALAVLADKRDTNPRKKHGNIPL
jgi:hypothetical protein